MKPQLRELLTQYGPIGAVWFDTPDQISAAHSADLRKFIVDLQPDCLINARIGNNRDDYDIHEQKIPESAIHRPWEACLTINRPWGYDKNDHQWKTPEMIVRCLVDVASKGGNFLINIGPTGEGVVPQPSIERLRSLGEWLAVNGEAIRGTTASRIGAAENKGSSSRRSTRTAAKNTSMQAARQHHMTLPCRVAGARPANRVSSIFISLINRRIAFKGDSGFNFGLRKLGRENLAGGGVC